MEKVQKRRIFQVRGNTLNTVLSYSAEMGISPTAALDAIVFDFTKRNNFVISNHGSKIMNDENK